MFRNAPLPCSSRCFWAADRARAGVSDDNGNDPGRDGWRDPARR
jgi:hypothetical protein